MGRFREQPIGESDIAEFLKGHDDFQLEISCLEALTRHGFTAAHGGIYEDPVTKKARQFDLRASIVTDRFKLRLAVECKCLAEFFPLVISRLPRRQEESFHEVIFSTEKEPLDIGSGAKTLRVEREHSIYKPTVQVGKSTTQLGRSEKGELITSDADFFDKWSQALASAHDLIHDAARDFEIEKTDCFFTIILPILVVPDGTLWVVDYSHNGVLTTKPQQTAAVEVFVGKDFWTGPYGANYTISHLDVLTKSSFDAFLNRPANDQTFWKQLFPEHLLEMIKQEDD